MFSGKIKELLSAELDIPASQMELHGWIHKNDAMIQDAVSQYSISNSVLCIICIMVDFAVIVNKLWTHHILCKNN